MNFLKMMNVKFKQTVIFKIQIEFFCRRAFLHFPIHHPGPKNKNFQISSQPDIMFDFGQKSPFGPASAVRNIPDRINAYVFGLTNLGNQGGLHITAYVSTHQSGKLPIEPPFFNGQCGISHLRVKPGFGLQTAYI